MQFLPLLFIIFLNLSNYKVKVIYGGKEIKSISLEDYLKGVVAGEMPASWHTEALKAQAVIARSFTIYHIKKGKNYFEASEKDQVWIPKEKWQNYSEKIEKAVDDTRGYVLTFPSGEVAPGFFHSTCGGKTENAIELWGGDENLKFIVSVKCSKCYDSPYFFWRERIKKEEIMRVSREINDVITQKILSLSYDIFAEYTDTGRVKKLFLPYGVFLTYYDMRNKLNLKSNFFKFEFDGEYFTFYGRGNGHGVGLCQWGAKKLAEEGLKWDEILKFYFPLLKIKKIY
ncbi:Amidase enhancer [bacterium HR19]|nr:Amidase enhancer [bacterium HR19]